MTSENTSDNLNLGRGWLNRAAEMLDSCEDHVSDAEFARAAAAIGNGFIALAHAERAMRSSATLDAAAERVRRAAAEARPHDDEPKPPRCTGCFGPFSDGTHGPGCTQRCQDCFGAPDGPGACRCRDGCTCEHPPDAGGLHRPNCPAYVAPPGEAAYLLEGDDEVFTPVVPHDGFRGFTRHGHPVDGEPPAGTPRPLARCGGPHSCAQCAADAARLRIPGRTEADLDG